MRQITQCFNQTMTSMLQEVVQLQHLTNLVLQCLEQNNTIPCRVSRFSQGCLVLTVEDAVWATQLRYQLPALRDQLRKAGLHHLTSLRVQLSPNTTASLKQKKQPTRRLSSQAKKTICESASHCDYPPLKEALKRLGEHHTLTKTPSG